MNAPYPLSDNYSKTKVRSGTAFNWVGRGEHPAANISKKTMLPTNIVLVVFSLNCRPNLLIKYLQTVSKPARLERNQWATRKSARMSLYQ